MVQADCRNLRNSSFIDVEEQEPCGSDPRMRWEKENEAEVASPLKEPEQKVSRWCFYSGAQTEGTGLSNEHTRLMTQHSGPVSHGQGLSLHDLSPCSRVMGGLCAQQHDD